MAKSVANYANSQLIKMEAVADGYAEGIALDVSVLRDMSEGLNERIAHAFVSMSEHEGFGVPLLEAMAAQVPVLAYAAAAVPETLGSATGVSVYTFSFPVSAFWPISP